MGPLLEVSEVSEAEDGLTWILAFEEGAVVFAELDEASDRLVLSIEIGSPEPASRVDLLELLLAYNGQWTRTGGIRMVLDEPGGQVVQMFELTAGDLEASRLAAILVRFLDIGLGWRRVVSASSNLESDSESDSDESTPQPEGGLRV